MKADKITRSVLVCPTSDKGLFGVSFQDYSKWVASNMPKIFQTSAVGQMVKVLKRKITQYF